MSKTDAWGYGAAPLLEPSTQGETEVVIFLSDIHAPYQDNGLVRSAIRLIEKVQPNRVVLNGDISDFFALSRFNLGMERLDDLQDEINMANSIREKVRTAAPNAQIIETEGNHDARLTKYILENGRALASLESLKPSNLFRYAELDIQWFPGAGFLLRPEYLVKHGTKTGGSEVPNAARQEFQLAGISGISGHTHRLGKYTKGGYVQREWVEQGCLCRTDPDYIVGKPNWTPGIVIGYYSTKTPSFLTELVQAYDGKLMYGGKPY